MNNKELATLKIAINDAVKSIRYGKNGLNRCLSSNSNELTTEHNRELNKAYTVLSNILDDLNNKNPIGTCK